MWEGEKPVKWALAGDRGTKLVATDDVVDVDDDYDVLNI